MKGKLLSGLIIIVFLISLAACGSLIANKSGDGDSDSYSSLAAGKRLFEQNTACISGCIRRE